MIEGQQAQYDVNSTTEASAMGAQNVPSRDSKDTVQGNNVRGVPELKIVEGSIASTMEVNPPCSNASECYNKARISRAAMHNLSDYARHLSDNWRAWSVGYHASSCPVMPKLLFPAR